MLHIDHRPKTLEEVAGNVAVKKSLESILGKGEKTPHAFLFTGPSGCGKTTLARILATALGIHDEDFKEIDSADFRGIDSVRDIRKAMRFKAIKGDRRGWLLDECHKLTNDAQNALLKGLEDTPQHVFFFLATTEPNKLLKTLKGRCTSFEVQSLEESELFKLCREVAFREGKKIPKEVLQQISRDAGGSPRVALVVLGKIIDMEEEDMLKAAEQAAAEESQVIDLCRSLMKGAKWPTIAKILKEIDAEPESTRYAVLGYFNSVLLNKGDARVAEMIEIFEDPFFNSGKAGLTRACFEANSL